MSEIAATKISSPASPVDWVRIHHGRQLAKKLYPGVVGDVLDDELDSWATSGHQFGGRGLINRLLDHLERLERAGEDIGVVTEGTVHRVEVEG